MKNHDSKVPHDDRINQEDLATCKQCGREISVKWHYCPDCGKEVCPQIERGIREIAKDIIAESRNHLWAEQELHFLMVEVLDAISRTKRTVNTRTALLRSAKEVFDTTDVEKMATMVESQNWVVVNSHFGVDQQLHFCLIRIS